MKDAFVNIVGIINVVLIMQINLPNAVGARFISPCVPISIHAGIFPGGLINRAPTPWVLVGVWDVVLRAVTLLELFAASTWARIVTANLR